MSVSMQHHALLLACTAESNEFEKALRNWEQVQDISDIDFATMRLVPYLYKKALALNVSMANEGICRGLYLRAWYLLTTVGSPSLKWIRENKLFDSAVILKGAAFQETIYSKDPPTRPADDVDLLISWDLVDGAFDLLQAAGMQMDHGLSRQTIQSLRNGANFFGANMAIDIHWNLLPVSMDASFTSRVLDRSVRLQDGLRTLSSTDHLLHTLVHGFARNEIPPIRWVLDATLLIRSGEVDWELFWEEVSLTGWYRVVRKQLRFLSEFGVMVQEPTGQRFRWSWFLLISEWLLLAKGRWVRRILRLLGYDFASWAQNSSRSLSISGYLLNGPEWMGHVLQEWKEYKGFRSNRG
jgi:hypothetical protein